MDADTILAILVARNLGVSRVSLRMYADALATYLEADENVRANGAVVAHPRTAQPMENPYLSVRVGAGRVLSSMPHIAATGLLDEE